MIEQRILINDIYRITIILACGTNYWHTVEEVYSMLNQLERGELKRIMQEEKPVKMKDERKDRFKCCWITRKEEKEGNCPRDREISTRSPKRVNETEKGLHCVEEI